jgi:excisionase family DNA binding protein
MASDTARLLTVSDAARLCSELGRPISASTVRDWADSGRLPTVRTTGGIRLFSRCDVVAIAIEPRTSEAGVR